MDDEEDIFEGSSEYRADNYLSEALQEVTPQEKIAFLMDVERQVRAYDPRVTGIPYCTLGSSSQERSIRNTRGLALRDAKNEIYVAVGVKVEANGEVKSGSVYQATIDFESLNASEIARKICEEALGQLGSKVIPNKTYPVLFRSDVAAALLATFVPIFSAENVQKGRSLLAGKLGSRIGVDALTIVDHPFLPDGLASRNFDDEGFASRELKVVEKGTLLSFLHNRKTAKKDGVESTGHARKAQFNGSVSIAPSNLYIEPSDTSCDDLVASIDDGVLVTSLSGLHSGANPVSGEFSLAAHGYHIANGQIAEPLNQLTVAGNFFAVLQSIQAIGADLEFHPAAGGSVGAPSLVIQELSITVET